jgi:hypothetical protein
MQVAVQGRREQVLAEPPGLALLDGDYVYAEYLAGDCLKDNFAFYPQQHQLRQRQCGYAHGAR